MSNKRYGFLRTVIFKTGMERIYRPIQSDDLEDLKWFYAQCTDLNTLPDTRYFNEVAIYDYEKACYCVNNFSERDNYIKKYKIKEVR